MKTAYIRARDFTRHYKHGNTTQKKKGGKGSCLVAFTPKLNPGVQIAVGPFNVGIYYLDPPPHIPSFVECPAMDESS